MISSRIVVDSSFVLSEDLQTIEGEFTVQGYLYTDYNLENIIFSVPARSYSCSRLPVL